MTDLHLVPNISTSSEFPFWIIISKDVLVWSIGSLSFSCASEIILIWDQVVSQKRNSSSMSLWFACLLTKLVNRFITCYFWLLLFDLSQTPTKMLSLSLSSTAQWEKITWKKSLSVKIKTQSSLVIHYHEQNRLDFWNIILVCGELKQIYMVRNKDS